MANKRIITTELDFDAIKASLKTYLQGQSQFSDYDFEGSGLSILLDVLAYNTHYNALYTNLAVNESFLDSASKRSSVVSRAKELGYTPRSATSAMAVVNVIVTVPSSFNGEALTLDAYTQFATQVEGTNFSFYNLDTAIAYRQGNLFVFNNVMIKEGTFLRYRYIVDQQTSYLIPNPDVDLSTVKVKVFDSPQTAAYTIFNHSDTLIDVEADSPVYFARETDTGLYELQFGNDIIGKALVSGNLVEIEYLSCNSALPNGASKFTHNGSLPSGASATVITTTKAYGGAYPEDIDSIKWNAPRYFAAQNRCVTVDDYKTVITSRYPNIDSINVWGGELNVPPSYGDVFLSIKPASGIILSDAEKNLIIEDIIGPRKVVTMHPKLVDPAYINVQMDISYYYDPSLTTRTAQDISNFIRQDVMAYNNNTLERFDGVLRFSQLSRIIDDAEPSILSNITTFKIRRPFDIVYNQTNEYIIDLANPIYNSGVPENSVISTGFRVINTTQMCYLDDLPTAGRTTGVMRLFYYIDGVKNFVRNVGTVDYQKGVIRINDLIITEAEGGYAELIIKTQSNDIVSSRNQIVSIQESLLNITPIANTRPDNYTFSSSRN